ncbi:TPA: Phytol kinase 1, chloroplastic [Trebouxia sp. C0006]
MKHVTHGANSICLPSSRVTLTSCIGPRVDIQRSLLIGSNSAALFRKGARQRSQNHRWKALARRLRSRRREVTVSHAGLQAAAQPWVAHDVTATVLAAAGAYVWVKLFDWMATRGLLEQTLSRKLVHITSGPLFVLTWPFFRWVLFESRLLPIRAAQE